MQLRDGTQVVIPKSERPERLREHLGIDLGPMWL